MVTISQTFSSAFSWMKMYEFWLTFQWNLFLMLTIFRQCCWNTVAKCDPWIHRATQSPAIDGPFGPFWPFLIGCMVSADYWLADYPELRRTTPPSTIGGPLGEPGFCIFCSTVSALVQIMAWRRQDDKPLFEPVMFSVLMHLCVTRIYWVKPLKCPDSKVHGANMGPIWTDRTQVGPMLAPWTLLSGWWLCTYSIPNLVITEPVNVSNAAGSSAGTVLIARLNMVFRFH